MKVAKGTMRTYQTEIQRHDQLMRTGARCATAHEVEILGLAHLTHNIAIALNILCCTGAKTFDEYKKELFKLHEDSMLETYFNEAMILKKKGAQ